MPDICTVIGSVAVTTLLGCMAPEKCSAPDMAGRSFCAPAHAVSCAPPMVRWQCRREDGSLYVFEEPFGARSDEPIRP